MGFFFYIYMITKFYITNDKNSNEKGQIVRELQKQYVKVRIKSLDITGISLIPGQVNTHVSAETL